MVNRTPPAGGAQRLDTEMASFETVTVDSNVAACDGDGGGLGHPKVYLNLEPAGQAECPYCSRLFVNRRAAAASAAPAPPGDAPAGRA